MAASNAGHVGANPADGIWAYNDPQLRIDFAYRGAHVTSQAATWAGAGSFTHAGTNLANEFLTGSGSEIRLILALNHVEYLLLTLMRAASLGTPGEHNHCGREQYDGEQQIAEIEQMHAHHLRQLP